MGAPALEHSEPGGAVVLAAQQMLVLGHPIANRHAFEYAVTAMQICGDY